LKEKELIKSVREGALKIKRERDKRERESWENKERELGAH